MKKFAFKTTFRYPLKGMFFVNRHSTLWKFISIPIIINLVLCLVLLYFFVFVFADVASDWINELILDSVSSVFGEATGNILNTTINIITWIAFFTIYIYVGPMFFSILSGLFAGIFNGILYDKVQSIKRRTEYLQSEVQFNILKEIKLFFKVLYIDILKIILFLILMILSAILNLVPAVGSGISVIISFLITTIFLGWDAFSSFFNKKDMGFIDQYKFVRSSISGMLGFGIVGYVLLIVPVLNIYFLSTNAAGAALLAYELEKER